MPTPNRPNLYTLSADMGNFFNTLMSDFNTQFGDSQHILNDLMGALEPIVKAGPQQYGFSAAEDSALRTMATENAALTTARASAFAGERSAAAAGGNEFIPSSVQSQIQGGIATAGLQELGREQLGITKAGYDRGLQEFEFATSALAAAPGEVARGVTLGGEAIGAEKTAFDQSKGLKATEGGPWATIAAIGGGVIGGALGGPAGAKIGEGLGAGIAGAATGTGGGSNIDVSGIFNSGTTGTPDDGGPNMGE